MKYLLQCKHGTDLPHNTSTDLFDIGTTVMNVPFLSVPMTSLEDTLVREDGTSSSPYSRLLVLSEMMDKAM